MVTKQELINALCDVDAQLLKNKEIIDAYSGLEVSADSNIIMLCEATKLLMIVKLKLKKRLLDTYGIYYI